MEHINFRITYDGPALSSHEMDASQIAPALLSINDLFTEFDATINKGSTATSVKVKGFEANCFTVQLGIDQQALEYAINLLNCPQCLTRIAS